MNPLTVNAFIGSLHEGVTIDDGWGFNELIGLALNYRSFDPSQLAGQTLPTVSSTAFGGLGDVLTVTQPTTQQMLVDIFGSSLQTPTNPPPDVNGVPHQPPTITPTTVAPTTVAGGGHAAGSPSATTTPTTTPPPSYNPTNCS